MSDLPILERKGGNRLGPPNGKRDLARLTLILDQKQVIMGKGAGRGKFKGRPTGQRTFSRIEDLAEGGSTVPRWRQKKEAENESGDTEEEESEEESEDEGNEKSKGVSGLIEVANLNAPQKSAVKVSQASALAEGSAAPQLSRREREELAKQQAQERYMRLQEQGKTEQAKKDLERLALIRKQREEAAKKREEERLEKEARKKEARK